MLPKVSVCIFFIFPLVFLFIMTIVSDTNARRDFAALSKASDVSFHRIVLPNLPNKGTWRIYIDCLVAVEYLELLV